MSTEGTYCIELLWLATAMCMAVSKQHTKETSLMTTTFFVYRCIHCIHPAEKCVSFLQAAGSIYVSPFHVYLVNFISLHSNIKNATIKSVFSKSTLILIFFKHCTVFRISVLLLTTIMLNIEQILRPFVHEEHGTNHWYYFE